MAVKRKKKRPPYDPYKPYGNHSLYWYQQQANNRAAADTNAAVGALPSSQFYTDSASQLASALGGIQGNQSKVAAAASPLYAQAFDSATASANKAAMSGGGTGVTATPGGGSLVGALGATMAQALSGGQSAAVARGRNDVIARAGQETAIRAKTPGLANQYLEKMKEDALQASVAGFNNQLAQSQFGLQASDTAFDNNLAAANLSADTARASSTSSARQSATNTRLRDKKLRAVEKRIEAWLKPVKKQTGAVYTFSPNLTDKNGNRLPSFDITAKDGPSAQAAAINKLTSMGIQGVTGTQVGSWLKSTKPTYGTASQKKKGDVYRIALRQLSGEGGVMTRSEARRWLRDYFGVSQTGPFPG